MRADSRIASVAVRNSNDAISVLSIADGALNEITGVLMRMAELSEQSANGVYLNEQRSALSKEFQALGSEIERIANTIEFNNIRLLSGSQAIVFQVGFDSASTSQISFQGVQGTLAALELGSSSHLSYSIMAGTEAESQNAARTTLDAVYRALEEVSKSRGLLGATESRLTTAINNLGSLRTNFEEAGSRIGDADIAQESAKLVRIQIQQQAATAVLAQANVQPQIALRLLTR